VLNRGDIYLLLLPAINGRIQAIGALFLLDQVTVAHDAAFDLHALSMSSLNSEILDTIRGHLHDVGRDCSGFGICFLRCDPSVVTIAINHNPSTLAHIFTELTAKARTLHYQG
jgi:hypothetical protein